MGKEEEEEPIEKVAWLADSGNKEEDGGKEEEGTMFSVWGQAVPYRIVYVGFFLFVPEKC